MQEVAATVGIVVYAVFAIAWLWTRYQEMQRERARIARRIRRCTCIVTEHDFLGVPVAYQRAMVEWERSLCGTHDDATESRRAGPRDDCQHFWSIPDGSPRQCLWCAATDDAAETAERADQYVRRGCA